MTGRHFRVRACVRACVQADCVAAAKQVLAMGITSTRIAAVGGSHGGFLSAHLTALGDGGGGAEAGEGRLDVAAACLRNPVTNIATMAGVTDIPDWCAVETASFSR